jgi:hypothetical protein
VLSPSRPPAPPPAAAPAPAGGALLRAGPVRVEPPGAPPARSAARDQRARLLLLTETGSRHLDDGRAW